MSIVRALAVLGAAGSGYMKGQQIARDRKRQDEDDAFKREQRERTRAGWADQDEQRERERNLEQGLRADAAPVTAAPAGMRDATADDRDVGMPDGPSFGIKVGNQVVPDQAAADASMAEQNTIPAVMRRQAKTLQGAGKADQADSRLQRAEALEKEGVLDALRGIRGAMPAFDGMAPGSEVQFDIPDDIATKFNSVGKVKIPKDAVARGRMREVDGVMLPDFSIVSKDGSKVYVKSGAEMEGAIGMTLAQRRTAALEGAKAKDARADKDADNKRLDATQAEQVRHNKAMERLTGMRAAGGGGGGTAPAPIGLNMADADKFINGLFTTKDEMTGRTVFNPTGAQAVRSLMLRMPAAQQGDTQGAVNQALAIYEQALKVAGGDHAKAMQAIDAASRPPPAAPVEAPAAPAPAAPAARPPAQATPQPSSMQGLSFRERQQRLAAQTEAMAKDPDLLRLEDERKRQLRAGNAAAANNAIAEMKRIKAERYGV